MISFTCYLMGQSSDSLDHKNFISYRVGFNQYSGGDIIKEIILKSPVLNFMNAFADSMFEIKSFTMTKVVKGKDPRELINDKNGFLTEDMIMEIEKSPVGTKLYFEHIKCIDNNNRIYSVNASSFIIN